MIRKLFIADLKMLRRDKQGLFWAIAFPCIFALIFGLFNFDAPVSRKVGVAQTSNSAASAGFVKALKKVPGFKVTSYSSADSLKTQVKNGKLDVGVVVPDLTQPGAVTIFYDESNAQANGPTLGTLNSLIQSFNLRAVGAPELIKATAVGIRARQIGYYDFLLPGLVAMGVMSFSLNGVGASMAKYRQMKILKRMLATPLSPRKFIVAEVFSRLVLAMLQTAIILTVGVVLFHAKIIGNIGWVFAMAAMANLIFLSIGFWVGSRAKTAEAASGMSQAIALPMMFLSGVFFPTEALPKILQTVFGYLPLAPIIKVMRSVVNDGSTPFVQTRQLTLMAGWLVVAFVIAVTTFRFSRDPA